MNRFDCSCDNVNTFGELMGQLNHTASNGRGRGLSCKNDDTGKMVEIFEYLGTPGMKLASTLKVRTLQKLAEMLLIQ